MHTFLALSFTIKNQDFFKIREVIENIVEDIRLNQPDEDIILVHGFMPRHLVLQKGFSTEVVDALDDIFPLQINCFRSGKPMRNEMASIIHEFGGEVHVIGTIVDGVAEEVDIYTKTVPNIVFHKLK